jgi:hypothetical protein
MLASLCVLSTAQATTYVRVEKDGTKTYSDRPIPGGEPIDLKPAQGYSAPPSSGISTAPPREAQTDNFRYQSCAITPENDSTFTNPDAVPIVVVTNPDLRSVDTATLTVDGHAVGPPGTTSYTMNAPLDRGTHTVTVTITGQSGQTMCSATSAFHVMRPGLNTPANRPRPTPH